MTTNALSRLETDGTTVKRAQYEAFEFDLEAPGLLRVTNGSHEHPDEHTYRVNVGDGVPTACECKSFEYRDGACKHMVAVAIRNPVLDAADGEPAVATDGGHPVDEETDGDDTGPREECWCADKDLPCFDHFAEEGDE